jgi:hypothetical protein
VILGEWFPTSERTLCLRNLGNHSPKDTASNIPEDLIPLRASYLLDHSKRLRRASRGVDILVVYLKLNFLVSGLRIVCMIANAWWGDNDSPSVYFISETAGRTLMKFGLWWLWGCTLHETFASEFWFVSVQYEQKFANKLCRWKVLQVGYSLDDGGVCFNSRPGQRMLLFSKESVSAVEPNPATCSLEQRIKRPGALFINTNYGGNVNVTMTGSFLKLIVLTYWIWLLINYENLVSILLSIKSRTTDVSENAKGYEVTPL